MTGKKVFYSSIAMILIICSSTLAHEKKWPERRLRQAWPEAQIFTSKQISLSASQINELKTDGIQVTSGERNTTFYIAQSKDASSNLTNLGAILFIDETGDNGPMEISIAMGKDGKTKKIAIWESSENPLVSKEEFLKQFEGKSASDQLVAEKNYKPISEAPKASAAIAKATSKALKITNKLFGKM